MLIAGGASWKSLPFQQGGIVRFSVAMVLDPIDAGDRNRFRWLVNVLSHKPSKRGTMKIVTLRRGAVQEIEGSVCFSELLAAAALNPE
jgi:hypothetical protein